jgi:hypothetical protein
VTKVEVSFGKIGMFSALWWGSTGPGVVLSAGLLNLLRYEVSSLFFVELYTGDEDGN